MIHHGGDYDRRERGLLALYRPTDLIEFDVHRAECVAGVVSYVPELFRVPYVCLAACAAAHKWILGTFTDHYPPAPPAHPCSYLWSSLMIQGSAGRFPPLIESAFEELSCLRTT